MPLNAGGYGLSYGSGQTITGVDIGGRPVGERQSRRRGGNSHEIFHRAALSLGPRSTPAGPAGPAPIINHSHAVAKWLPAMVRPLCRPAWGREDARKCPSSTAG